MAYGSVNVPGKLTAEQVGALPVDGNAASAAKLSTARTIDGVDFDGSASVTHYGTCGTVAATAAKVVSLTGFKLGTGARIEVKFTYANSTAAPTLNVNNTGAKPIKKYGTTAPDAYMWQAGAVVEFVYDGTNWVMKHGTTATTTYYGLTKLSDSLNDSSTTLAATANSVRRAYNEAQNRVPYWVKIDGVAIGQSGGIPTDVKHFCICSTDGAVEEKTVSLNCFNLVEGARLEVKFSNANTAGAPTLNVNNTGAKPIKVYGANIPGSYMWQAESVIEVIFDGTNWLIVNGSAIQTVYNELHTRTVKIGVNASVGLPSVPAIAIGDSAKSNASSSIAIGPSATCGGDYSVVIGQGTQINSGVGFVAIGRNVTAPNGGSGFVAIGNRSVAGDGSVVAIGEQANAAMNGCVAIGVGATTNNNCEIAIGKSATTKYGESIAIGNMSKATMVCSVALGRNAQATGNFSVAIGQNATTAESRVIQLGDGYVSALKCKVSLTITSDERDKADITPVDNGATEFLELVRAIRYVWNGRASYIDEETMTDEDRDNIANYGMCAYDKEAHARGDKKGHRIRVGVSAQQVQEALQAVYGDSSYANIVNDNFFDYDPDDIPDGVENQLSVNYDGFIPFLIKSVQELSARIKKLEGDGHA